jgi:hypothetical protein
MRKEGQGGNMKKLMLLAILVCCFAASNGASRSSDKVQVVYREAVDGEFRIHIFGPYCPSTMHLRVVEPKDSTEPIEVLCEYK